MAIRTIVLQRRNFKVDPYWIELRVDGSVVASVWSKRAKITGYDSGAGWMLSIGQSVIDAFLHADNILFRPHPRN